MRIPESGTGKKEIFDRLESFRDKDLKWREGRVFGHAFMVNDDVTAVVERAYTMYLWENALDPLLFGSLMRMENEVVAMSVSHLRGDADTAGNFTSGGTESIMLAVKSARDKAAAERPGIGEPEIVLPVTAHAAFHKAASYFRLNRVMVPVDPVTFRADVKAIEKAVSPRTVLVAASAPSYAHGVVDPIPDIGAVALKRGVPFHVDGCMGALILPFYRELGAEVTDFDFSVPGVTSISMDFHKYGFAAKGASVVLYRDRDLRKHQIFTCSDWTGYTMVNPTMQSSRSGGPLAATWAVLHYLGREGFLAVASDLKNATEKIIRGIGEIPGLRVLGKPDMCLVGVAAEGLNVFHVVDEMKLRGWHIQAQFGLGRDCPPNFHVTVLPGNVKMIDRWLEDLRESAGAARHLAIGPLAASIVESSGKGEAVSLGGADIGEVMKAVGVEGDTMPSRMADINEILNALPRDVADDLLRSFYNELFMYREKS